ncbi:Bcmfs1 [Apiospora rasikravindrae]|uniref:Bcmfs1 n=1 Tax=Apiospora rasikravindrae TaxID=990691 RepID=A0ABR1RYG8_9PEZI
MSTNAVVDDDDVGPLDAIEEHEYPGGMRLTAIVFALVLSIFLASLDTTIITTAIPSITNDFHSLEDVGWYGSAMFFPMAATQSVWGKAYKYFPVKLVFLLGILIFEVGSLICVMPSSLGAPLRAQAAPVNDKFLIGHFCRRVGGWTVDWRRVYAECDLALVLSSTSFYINLPCGGVAAIATLLAFRAPKAASPVSATRKETFLQMDIPGAVLICAVIVCFTLALRWGGVERAWNDSKVVGTLVATPVLLILFGLDQRLQGERALIMPSFLRNRVLLVGAIFEFFIAGCFNLALFYLPIYFQAVRGVSAVSSGIWLIPVILSLTITQIVVGGLITATGIHNPFLILGPAVAAVGSGLFMLLDQQSSAGRWIGFQIILGIGVGFCLTIPLMLSQVAVKTKDVSTATSIVIFSQSIGSAFLLPTAQSVFQNQLLKALRRFAPDIDPSLVLSAGASNEAIMSLPASSLGGIVRSYTRALRFAFAIGVPFAGVALCVGFFMPWFRYQDASKASVTATRPLDKPEKGSGVKVEDGK